MTKQEIDDIVQTVCDGEYKCPVFEAYDANGGADKHCFERDECPLRHSLELYRRYKMAAKKSDGMKAKPAECEKTIPVPKDESLGGVQLWAGGPFWAECNLGATKPEEFGYYFQWGGTTGYVRNKKNDGWVSAKDGRPFKFNWKNCATYEKEMAELTKMGYLDGNGNLAPEHDAATAYLGDMWRMPTKDDIDNLISKCDSEWTSLNGVYGRLVKGKGDFAANSIFLPAAGSGSRLNGPISSGIYWSSNPDSRCSYRAWRLYFDSGDFARNSLYHDYGRSVRPLRDAGKEAK